MTFVGIYNIIYTLQGVDSMKKIEKRFKAIQEMEPDEEDIKAIARIIKQNDTSDGISLNEMDEIKMKQDYSGKISLRVPKTLHCQLVESAKQEGISLNQFILYKLAK